MESLSEKSWKSRYRVTWWEKKLLSTYPHLPNDLPAVVSRLAKAGALPQIVHMQST